MSLDIEKIVKEKTEDIIIDKIADEVTNKFSDEQLISLVDEVVRDIIVKKENFKWYKEYNRLKVVISEKFMKKVSLKLDEIINLPEFDEKANECAKQIIDDAKKVSEEYMVEAIARSICLVQMDFDGSRRKFDIHDITQRVIHDHLQRDHNY